MTDETNRFPHGLEYTQNLVIDAVRFREREFDTELERIEEAHRLNEGLRELNIKTFGPVHLPNTGALESVSHGNDICYTAPDGSTTHLLDWIGGFSADLGNVTHEINRLNMLVQEIEEVVLSAEGFERKLEAGVRALRSAKRVLLDHGSRMQVRRQHRPNGYLVLEGTEIKWIVHTGEGRWVEHSLDAKLAGALRILKAIEDDDE